MDWLNEKINKEFFQLKLIRDMIGLIYHKKVNNDKNKYLHVYFNIRYF